jgi:hypothetical protein
MGKRAYLRNGDRLIRHVGFHSEVVGQTTSIVVAVVTEAFPQTCGYW